MVKGLDRFKESFLGESDQYVLIGGVAAMHWLEQASLQARATKDLDIVLLVEARRSGFQQKFWDFVRAGGYGNRQKSTGDRVYYRFSHPHEEDYPYMLELFSRKPDDLDMTGAPEIIPIPGEDDVSSLSAILMDDAYYKIVRDNVQEEDGLPMLRPEGLILLKARAWLDLTERRDQGGVDSRDIKKHRTDVFRLSQLLTPAEPVSVPANVHEDLLRFLDHFPEDSADWVGISQALGVRTEGFAAATLNVLRRAFLVSE